MKPKVNPKSLSETRWHEYAIRFLFGGLVTALAGWIATKYGPVLGGLFLSFPAILPASVTLVQDHQAKKENIQKAKDEAGEDSEGAAMGSFGLAGFGLIVWALMSGTSAILTLAVASAVWLALALGLWWLVVGRKPERKAKRAAPNSREVRSKTVPSSR